MSRKRQPGDTSMITESNPAYYRRTGPNGVRSSTWSIVSYLDLRPTYAKGALLTLPGGSKFRCGTSYSHESWTAGTPSPALAIDSNGNIATDDGQYLGPLLTGNPVAIGPKLSGDAENEAVTKALNKLADQKVNLGENLLTMRQTAGMFTSRGKALSEALHSIKRNRSFAPYLRHSFSSLRKEGLLNRASREYLEYVYGLKPLMSDVYALWQLARGHSSSPLLLRGVGKASRSLQTYASYGTEPTLSERRISDTTKTKATLWARLDPNHQGIRAMNQLGLLNPLGLAWDLTSYSFVVDWFLPVGDVLYALSAPAGLIFVDGTLSAKCTGTQVYTWDTSTLTPYATKSRKKGEMRRDYAGFARKRYTSWPLPGLWVKPDPFGSDRSLKALALSIQALKRP